MYVVGAQVVSALSSVRFIDFVKDRIFTPLNMTQTTYFVDEALRSGQSKRDMDALWTANTPVDGGTARRSYGWSRWRHIQRERFGTWHAAALSANRNKG